MQEKLLSVKARPAISLGGVRDQAQICAYVTSSRGSVVQLLPVILLDEVDKTGQSNLHGDPSTALLEILDLKQNWSFNNDHIHLSQVLFIYTTNFLDTISSPLFNRCEIVHLAGDWFDEKVATANRCLVSKQIEINGLRKH